ncbi:MAG: Sec-independent protein translocase protein TatB [Acidobacteriota bacterium]|nr:Sec-independent protein translocase protein TatB [Acidobacteriota bacterium]
MLGNIGPMELFVIFVIALLVFGPKKLPEIGRSIGKALREFKKTSEEIRGRIEEEIEASTSDIKEAGKDITRDIEEAQKNIRDEIEDIYADKGKDADSRDENEEDGTKVS